MERTALADIRTFHELSGRHLRLTDTNVAGVRAVEPPPPDFDPRTADTTTLLRYGLIPRPDAQSFPAATRVWDRVTGAATTHIVPELARRPEKRDRVHPALRDAVEPHVTPTGELTNNWSGAVIHNP